MRLLPGSVAFAVTGHAEAGGQLLRADSKHRAQANVSQVRKLTRGGFSGFAPRWSPDGDRLVVTATQPDVPEPRLGDRARLGDIRIGVLDREGNQLLDIPGFMPDWMPPWR